MVRILLPTAPPDESASSETFSVGGPLTRLKVGLRLDESWRSYYVVVDQWEQMFRRDGAAPIRLVTGDRVGPVAEQTRNDLDAWSRLVECAVIGLGN
jgi:hypothetical protein